LPSLEGSPVPPVTPDCASEGFSWEAASNGDAS
jgi:hypothetical protein